MPRAKSKKNIDDSKLENGYYLYILLCADNSYYIGTTNNMKKRFIAHSNGKGAKYTAFKKVLGIEALWVLESKSIALSVEKVIKQASKKQKSAFIENTFALKKFYKNKMSIDIKIHRAKKPKIDDTNV